MEFKTAKQALPKVEALQKSNQASNFQVALKNIEGFFSGDEWARNKITKIMSGPDIYLYRFDINTRIAFTFQTDTHGKAYIIILAILDKEDGEIRIEKIK